MFIASAKEIAFTNHRCVNYKENPTLRLKMGEDGHTNRRGKLKSAIIHTTNGISPQTVLPGKGPVGNAAENTLRYWTGSDRNAGAHLILDYDATWVQTADLITETTYHATSINEVSFGIEICARTKQTRTGTISEVYSDQLDECADLVCELFNLFDIYPQTQYPYNKNAIKRLAKGGGDCVGAFCHFHQTTNRGPGDCGEEFFKRLYARGFKLFDFSTTADLDYWKSLGIPECADGIPGIATVKKLKKMGLYPELKQENGHVFFSHK